jgi:hypothetical protein
MQVAVTRFRQSGLAASGGCAARAAALPAGWWRKRGSGLVTRWLAGTTLLLGLSGLLSQGRCAQTSPYTPYQHRAWYIYLIAQYTEWPKEAFTNSAAPFIIGILGDDRFGKDIDIIRNRTIKERKLVIRSCASSMDLSGCHVLIVSESERERLPDILTVLGNAATLTVSEMENFTEQNGMVRFWVERKTRKEGFLRFEINQAAAERAGLRIKSHVLNLARTEPKED